VSRRTRVAAALSAAAVLLVTGALFSGAPARASGLITASASSPLTNAGDLSVTFTAGTAIASFTAHIITASGTDVLDLPEAEFIETSTSTSSDTVSSAWTLKSGITASQLPLGIYEVTVDATDTGSDSVTGQPAGTLDYLIQPTVSLSADFAVLSYASPSTTLSGTVTGLWPGGATGPIAGQEVVVADSEGQSQDAQTDADGDFSMPVSAPGTFTATVSGSTLATTSSSPVVVTAVTTPTELTATVSTTQVDYGEQVTVTGQLSYQPDTTWQGLSGLPVVVDAPGYPQLSIPVTGTDGSFTATFAATQSGPVQVFFDNAQYQESGSFPYLAPAQATTSTITVDRQTSLTRFSASVSTAKVVTVSGCVGVSDLPAGAGSVSGTLTIQYSASKTGPWRKLGTISKINGNAGSTCGIATVEGSFTGAFPVQRGTAYYRAEFTPQASANLLSSVSATALAWKYPTQVEALKVSARRVAKGSKLTISGELLQDTKRWGGYGHQLVQIVYRKPGAKTSYWVVKVRTNSAGKFTATVTDTFSATWSAYYPGNATHYYCSSAGVKVTVS